MSYCTSVCLCLDEYVIRLSNNDRVIKMTAVQSQKN